MSNFVLSAHSLAKLEGVHPDLVRVVKRALDISRLDFSVTDGLRTTEQERKHVEDGTSHTMNSRHLTGHAVDLTPWANGKSVSGDILADRHYFSTVAKFMKMAALECKIPIEWGGDWPPEEYDGYHYQLTWKAYPLK